jgi:hypothetical protein
MDAVWYVLKIMGYVLTGAKTALACLRGLAATIVRRARERAEEGARAMDTVCVVRGCRVPLRWYERVAVLFHRMLGLGAARGVRGRAIEASVDVTPPVILMAAAARARFSSHSRDWWSDDNYYH